MKAPCQVICQPFSCERDGLTIRGFQYMPSGLNAPAPAVVMSHGFMADHGMCDGYAGLLAGLGFVTFTFDFCGGGPNSISDGRTRDMSVLTEKEDLLAVMRFARALPEVDPARLSLLGCSQGGYVSAMTAKEHPEEVEKLILFYPALCIPDDARSGQMLAFRFDPQNIPDLLGTQPMELGGCYARAVVNEDAFSQSAGFTGKTLILHGDQDAIVKLSYAERAVACYADARLHVIKGAGHVFFGDHDAEAKRILSAFMLGEE